MEALKSTYANTYTLQSHLPTNIEIYSTISNLQNHVFRINLPNLLHRQVQLFTRKSVS